MIREGYAGMADTAAARDDDAFREEVRSFIRDHYPQEMRVAAPYEELDKEQQLLWHRVLHKKGWSAPHRSEEHTSELQSLMRISYAVFCLKKKNEEANDQFHYTSTTQPQLP